MNTVTSTRISERPELFQTVFDGFVGVMESVRSGQLEPSEANAISRAGSGAVKALEADLKSRMIEARMVRTNPRQLEKQAA